VRNGILCIVGAVVPLLAGAHAMARCSSTATCLQAIEQAQKETRTLAAAFVQVKHLNLLEEPLVSSGRFVFKRPDRMLLKIEQPQPASVVINGQDVQIPNLPARERQALGNLPIASTFTKLGAIFTGSMQELQGNFEVAAFEEDGTIHVRLVPRRSAGQAMFQTIEIVFSGADLTARQIQLQDVLGDTVQITLRDVQRNIEVPDSTFELGK
jgi:outer membrane lipoprotein-sorting protein